jgi:very-short-patch-repair endonuclease
VGHTATVPLAAEAAALLAVGNQAVLSHRAALRLHRLLPPDLRAAIDVTLAPTASAHPRRGIRVHRSRTLVAGYIRTTSNLPVTVPERALLDAAPALTDRQLERALDEALALRITSQTKLTRILADANGHPGRGKLAAAVATRGLSPTTSTVTESEAEERFLGVIRAAGLPAPQLQVQLYGYRVDAYWPQAKLAVEIDGFQWHSTKAAFERDRRKQLTLQAHGIEVTRITWELITERQLEMVAHISRRIAERVTESERMTQRPSQPSL